MILAFILEARGDCGDPPLAQDLNCNDIGVEDEPSVDLTDPVCAANVDSEGVPFPNADWYYDYGSFGCTWPMIDYDSDEDGLGGGYFDLGDANGQPTLAIFLTCDNCPVDTNPDQTDSDCDGYGDPCDTCPFEADPLQADSDFDTIGNECDNCSAVPNVDQADSDGDGAGDACDVCPYLAGASAGDDDEDGIGDACDNCVFVYNRDQADTDGDNVGNACDVCADGDDRIDADSDQVPDACDGCPTIYEGSPSPDDDGDGVGDPCDLCPDLPTGEESDLDGDGAGDGCDNCPSEPNADQEDGDDDGKGDLCDDDALRGDGCRTKHAGIGLFLLGALAIRRGGRARG